MRRINPLEKQTLIEYHKSGPKFISDKYSGQLVIDVYTHDNDALFDYFDNILQHELCSRHLKCVIMDIKKNLKQ